MSIADNQADAVTGLAPEAVEGETTIIAPLDEAVTHLQAWSQETVPDDAVVPYPTTGTVVTPVTLSRDKHWSWPLTIVIAVGFVVAPVLIVAEVEPTPTVSTSESTTPTHEPLSCPVGTKPGAAGNCDVAEPLPPVTVVPPPVTVMAVPPTVTQTIAPNPRAVFPTPALRNTGVALFDARIAEAPPSDRMPSAAEALAEGREACTLLDGGKTRTQTDDILAAEHFAAYDYGTAFGSADWIVLQAQHHLC